MKYKHLTYEDRQTIAGALNERCSFKEIGKQIEKDASTISKEVRAHFVISRSGCWGKPFNDCIRRFRCGMAALCPDCKNHRLIGRCRFCVRCTSVCIKYEKQECPRLEKPPYVCNGCEQRKKNCTLEKRLYVAKEAQQEYERTIRESREGISLTEEEIAQLDQLISPLLKQGQSIHHVCANHKDEIMISESTLYRLIDYSLFTARNLDLPRKVRYRKRKKKKQFKVDKSCRIGRDYAAYQTYIEEHPELPVTQMDSVEGKKGGSVLLTIHFVNAGFMLAFLRERNDSKSVINIFEELYNLLGQERFTKIMPILLGDNGSEFSNPKAIEFNSQGERRTRVYYCDPSAPHQKGAAERNHEFIRMFIKKGTPFDGYTQEDISLMMDHINSYGRPELNDRTPYDMMTFLYGTEILELLGSRRIEADDVTLNPSIFRKGGSDNDQKRSGL